MADLSIPTDLLPRAGRFGCGPSEIRGAQLERLVPAGATTLGATWAWSATRRCVAIT